MRAANTSVHKLLVGGGDFEAFRSAGATHCTDGMRWTLSR